MLKPLRMIKKKHCKAPCHHSQLVQDPHIMWVDLHVYRFILPQYCFEDHLNHKHIYIPAKNWFLNRTTNNV